mgnify:CR=1 FL=1
MQLSDPVVAALIMATTTFITAMIQLSINARRQAAERAAGKPASRKSGNWLAILALMLASTVGGYALSEYQAYQDRDQNQAMRDELQLRLRELGATAQRLERAGLDRGGQNEADTRLAVERRRGAEGVAAVIDVPACRTSQVGFSQAPPACTENDAIRATLCAVIPAAATVTEVQVFTRIEDAQQGWSEARVQPGQDAGGARFAASPIERPASGDAREVCQQFAHWSSQKGRSARLLVKYAP